MTEEEIGNGWRHPGWKLVTLLTTASLILTALQIDAVPRWISAAGARIFFHDPTHITYSVYYSNVGAAPQSGVSFKVTLPGDAKYVKGTSYYRSADDADWKSIGDGITDDGIGFSGFAPKDAIYIAFTAQLNGKGKHTCNGDGVSLRVTTKGSKVTTIESSTEIQAHCA